MIIILIILVSFLYFRFVEEFDSPSHDEIQVGYNLNDESLRITNPKNSITRNRSFKVVVIYSEMVEDNTNSPAKLQIVDLGNDKVVFEDYWTDSYGISGTTKEINPKNWVKGQYKIELYRQNKLQTTKTIEVN